MWNETKLIVMYVNFILFLRKNQCKSVLEEQSKNKLTVKYIYINGLYEYNVWLYITAYFLCPFVYPSENLRRKREFSWLIFKIDGRNLWWWLSLLRSIQYIHYFVFALSVILQKTCIIYNFIGYSVICTHSLTTFCFSFWQYHCCL